MCDQVLDTRGHHARICRAGGDRVLRHNRVRNENFRFCCTAGAHPELEKSGLLLPSRPSDGARSLRRPADVYLPCWTGGFPAALDFAVTAPQRQGIVSIAAVESLATATAYSQTKRDYQETEKACALQGVKFIPMVCETSGAWATEARETLLLLAKASAARSGKTTAKTYRELLQRTSVAVRTANARAHLKRFQ